MQDIEINKHVIKITTKALFHSFI